MASSNDSAPCVSLKFFVCLSLFVLLLALACIIWVDLPVAKYMRSLDPQVRAVAEPVTKIGQAEWPLLVLALTAAFFSFQRRWDLANRSMFVFVSIVTTLVVHLLKVGFGRARPKLYFLDDPVYGFSFFTFLQQGNGYYDHASFPSGHSAVAGALAVGVWLVSPNRLRWPVLVLSVLIAVSRVVLTSHWVADTLAGFLLGAGCAAFMHWRFTRRGWLKASTGLFRR